MLQRFRSAVSCVGDLVIRITSIFLVRIAVVDSL